MNELRNKSFEDLLLDESFREFVENTNKESVDFWNGWILDHPRKSR